MKKKSLKEPLMEETKPFSPYVIGMIIIFAGLIFPIIKIYTINPTKIYYELLFIISLIMIIIGILCFILPNRIGKPVAKFLNWYTCP